MKKEWPWDQFPEDKSTWQSCLDEVSRLDKEIESLMSVEYKLAKSKDEVERVQTEFDSYVKASDTQSNHLEEEVERLTRDLAKSDDVVRIAYKKNGKWSKKLGRAKEALESIKSRDGMTMLSDCCVDKTCIPAFVDHKQMSVCQYQWGVARGYSECAGVAESALKAIK